jgi:hypothetical protein
VERSPRKKEAGVKALAVILALVLFVAAAQAYTSGVPTGLTGAPGEGTCANCHDNLNNGAGSVAISAPYEYAAGETLEVTVDVAHPGQKKWGFELTCLDGADEPAGEFIITDPSRTQLDVDDGNGRGYVMHTATGTDEGTTDASPGWTFRWVAPSDSRPQVTFYVCAVAANNAQGTNGDFCYTLALPIDQSPVESSSWGRVKGLFQ